MASSVIVTGSFPPPIDGQNIATRRLASLLSSELIVHRVDLSSGDTRFAESKVLLRPGKIWHYLTAIPQLHDRFSELSNLPVLWTSISPTPLGHLRDRMTVLPSFAADQEVYGVVHWGNFDRLFRSPLTQLSGRRLVDRLHGFVFLTHELARRCSSWIPADKRFVVPNTIDESVMCSDVEVALKQEERTNRSSLRLLFLSNMTPSKGFMDVLHATRLLLERGFEVYTDFVGRWESPKDRDTFRVAVEKHNLDSQITHHEAIDDREQIKALYMQADLFVLPTYYPHEAQPLTIIEALNAGTPIVATEHAGIPEMFTDESEGRFVPAEDARAIAEAVEAIQPAEAWVHYSQAARERFLEQFSPKVVRRKWLDLLER